MTKKLDLQKYLLQEKDKVMRLWENPKYQITEGWLRGFIEADGSFIHDNVNKAPRFEISQHKSDFGLLKAIQSFFRGGSIGADGDTLKYRLSEKENILKKVLPICNMGFLFEEKKKSYQTWLKEYFPEIRLPKKKSFQDLFDMPWFYGFTDGDGSFFLRITKVKDRIRNDKIVKQSKTNYQVRAVFDLAQQNGEPVFWFLGKLLFPEKNKRNKYYFEVLPDNSKDSSTVAHLRLTSYKILQFQVLPLFHDEALQSRKRLIFCLWKATLFLMEKKLHCTNQGLEVIEEFDRLIDFFRVTPPANFL